MTRNLPRTNFHSSQLIRCLAELDLLEGAEPASDFADKLGQWMHFTDAIALSSVLESGMAKVPAQSQVLREATSVRLTAEFERIRAFMVNSITKSCALTGGNTHIKLPLVDLEISYAPYRQFYDAHQRDMELSVEPLRVNLRDALAKASPRLRKLAELDVVMEKFLREREGRLLARVPLLLQKHFDALYAANREQLAASGQPDTPAAWMHPGGWLARFCQTLQTLLLAGAELRLQPSAGLLEAYNQKNTMNKHLFNLAFVTGAFAVIWVGFGFIDSSALAMAMTALIFAVYLAGAVELHRFRQATASLTMALGAIPEDLPDLNRFLSGLDGSLQHPVRLRIEGERAGLPGPSLTPYLVGLLVMLGMLGTFLGMVVTLKGAVFTLEKSADLETMRSALAVPVKGLGLAFGTSVAGVAASAVLGLMSALCRRERMQAGQLLDAKAATVLSGFSHARQREHTFRALQLQSEALPQVVDKLQAMMLQIEAMSGQLNQRLLANQEQLHSSASETYTALARSVDKSLRESLADSAQAAGESIKPIFEATMHGIAQETTAMHERTAATVQQQLDGLADRFSVATASVAQTWSAALDSQKQANRSLATDMGRSLEAFSVSFDQRAGAMVAKVGAALESQEQTNRSLTTDMGRSLEAFSASFDQRAGAMVAKVGDALDSQQQANRSLTTDMGRSLEAFGASFDQRAGAMVAKVGDALDSQEQANRSLATDMGRSLEAFNASFDQRAGALVAEVGDAHAKLQVGQAAHDAQRQQAWTQSLEAIAATLTRELRDSGAQVLTQQREICTAVTHAVRELADQAHAGAGASLAETTRLITTAEDLMRSRIAAEAQWLDQHRERMDQLTSMLQAELGALRHQEAARGAAAVAHLGELQAAVTTHLTTLGAALEAPITRLIETAAEAPRAAAEVIGQMRQEISHSVARDNALLDERSRIMETLNALLDVINHASHEQRAVIDSLVASSSVKLDAASIAFSADIASESRKLSEIAANVTTSAVDVASLADAFGVAVRSFNAANEKLAFNLDRIEVALDKSMTRSDGQLAYYVAQAREIIDLSMSSQKEIIEELRQLPAMLADEGK